MIKKIAGSEWLPTYVRQSMEAARSKSGKPVDLPGQSESRKAAESSNQRKQVWQAAVNNERALDASIEAKLKTKKPKGNFHAIG